MKIVYCIKTTNIIGGLDRIISIKANYLASKGHDVSIITIEQGNNPPVYEYNPHIHHYDLGVKYSANRNRPLLLKIIHYYINKWNHHRRLKKLLFSIKADIVISTFCNHMGHLPKIKDGSRKILEFHGSHDIYIGPKGKGIQGLIEYKERKNLNILASQYDKFVTLTREDMDKWINVPNICQIYNALPFGITTPSKLENKIVVSLGRLSFEKGFDRLIEIWRIVNLNRPDWQLIIYGDGDEKETIQDMINKYNLSKSVLLKGQIIDVSEAYSTSSIYVLPSRTEGFAMCLIEAQNFGLPIVSFNISCGPKEIIHDGRDGFLIKDGDYNQMANTIIKLIDDEELRKEMGKRALMNSQRFNQDNIMNEWINLFEQLTAENK